MAIKQAKNTTNEHFMQYLVGDLLHDIPHIHAKKMFGSYGLYYTEKMCGIIHNQTLYLKTNQKTREKYTAPECKPFTYVKEGKTTSLKNYIAVPTRLLDDAEELLVFILESAKL